MKSSIGHLVIGIHPENISFYKDLLSFLGWQVSYQDPNMIGMESESGASLWFGAPLKEVKNDYDGIGMNHLGIVVETPADVDQVVAYLLEHGTPALFETPRHRPEFSMPGKDYYQVMFESPDRVLFEVVYIGPAQN